MFGAALVYLCFYLVDYLKHDVIELKNTGKISDDIALMLS